MKLPPHWLWPRRKPAPDVTENELVSRLDQITASLRFLTAQGTHIMASVADVQAALSSNETKQQTIIGLLQTEQKLQQDTLAQLQALQASGSTDPAALQAVVDKMTADGANMDAAIASVQAPAKPAP